MSIPFSQPSTQAPWLAGGSASSVSPTPFVFGGTNFDLPLFPDLDDFTSLLNSVSGTNNFSSPSITTPPPSVAGSLPAMSDVSASADPLSFQDLEALFASVDSAPTSSSSLLSSPLGGSFPMEDFIFADLLSAQEAAPSTAAPSLITPRSMARDPGVASRQKPTHLNGHPLSPISAGSHDEASHDESAPVVQNKDTKRRKLSAEEKEARARDRAIRNRQAAQDSRDKKRKYIDDLEASNTELANHNKQLVERLQSTEQTNMTLASRLEQMATQLATFRKRFKTTNTPSGITDMTDTLTLGALSSDPAAVRRRTSQHVTSIQHGSTSSENGAPVSYVTPLLTEMSTTKRSSLSVSNPNAGTSHPPSPSTSRTISTSPQAHPLATLVVTTLFNSLVFLTSGARAASGLASVLTLGSESTRPVDGVDANTAPFHTVKNRTSSGAVIPLRDPIFTPRTSTIGLTPRLDLYLSSRTASRLDKFPILQRIWATPPAALGLISSF